MKKNSDQPITYESAWAELQMIVGELQAETVGVDELSEKIARATVLTNFCRERLRNTEEQLEKMTKE
jgi:exodeoxyribonuclease VII small subunit